MLGLIGEGTGIAAKVLKSMGESADATVSPPLQCNLPYPLSRADKNFVSRPR